MGLSSIEDFQKEENAHINCYRQYDQLDCMHTTSQIKYHNDRQMLGADKHVAQLLRLISEEFIGGIILQTTLDALNEIVNPW